MSTRLSFNLYDELTQEEQKILLAAKNHLSKSEDEWNDIIEGYQLLDVFSLLLFKCYYYNRLSVKI